MLAEMTCKIVTTLMHAVKDRRCRGRSRGKGEITCKIVTTLMHTGRDRRGRDRGRG